MNANEVRYSLVEQGFTRFGTPDEGGPDTARSVYRDGEDGEAPRLTIESRGETGAVLEWLALRNEGSGNRSRQSLKG